MMNEIVIDHELYGDRAIFGSIGDATESIRACGLEFAEFTPEIRPTGEVYDQRGNRIGRSVEQVIVNELDGSTFHTTDCGPISEVMDRSDDRLKALILDAVDAEDGIAQESWEEDGEEFSVKVIVR